MLQMYACVCNPNVVYAWRYRVFLRCMCVHKLEGSSTSPLTIFHRKRVIYLRSLVPGAQDPVSRASYTDVTVTQRHARKHSPELSGKDLGNASGIANKTPKCALTTKGQIAGLATRIEPDVRDALPSQRAPLFVWKEPEKNK